MQIAVAQAIELPKHGCDGNPQIMREPRDIPGRGKRKIEGTQNINVDRLEWYQAHGHTEQFHTDAGRQLQHDCELAQIGGYASMGSGGARSVRLVPSNLPDAKCDAIARVNRARDALEPGVWRLLELVVIDNLALEVAGYRLWRRHIRKHDRVKALVYALDQLAKHYGMYVGNAR